MTSAKKETFGDMARSLVIAVFLALLFRSVAFEPFHIPSGSMKPTLLVGDYIFVSKYSYGFSRHSLPWSLPLFSGRVLCTPPQRGDVVVFRLPNAPSISFIKRVIGLPGDTVQMIDGVLYINGAMVPKERIEDFEEASEDGTLHR